MGFRYKVGETYTTQAGQLVKVVARFKSIFGYETVVGNDGRHRYDRSGPYADDYGRCTGTAWDYSYPHNFKRVDKPASNRSE